MQLFVQAEEYKQNEKYAKTNAFTDIIIQNENATTLDLHFLPVTNITNVC